MDNKNEELLIRMAEILENQHGYIRDLLNQQQSRTSWQKFSVIASILSLAISPIFIWQMFEIKQENRENFINRVAYESATQNVLNKYIGQNAGRAQAEKALIIQNFKTEVDTEAKKFVQKNLKETY